MGREDLTGSPISSYTVEVSSAGRKTGVLNGTEPHAQVISRNPATGEIVHRDDALSGDELSARIARVDAAQRVWIDVSMSERVALLRRFADALDGASDALRDAIVTEVGKLRGEAAGEVAGTVATARWYADHPPVDEHRGAATVIRRPLGVIGLISPWNVPLITPMWRLLPGLLAGNGVVWKPSELATRVALLAVEQLRAAGAPDGLVEVTPGGPETGRELCEHPLVRGVAFTGSTAAGRAIAASVAQRFIPHSLEMGGSNPAVVFADADLELAADCVAATVGSLQGQKCTTTRRVLVQAEVADELTRLLSERFAGFIAGDPAEDRTTLGPLITPAAAAAGRGAVADALARGARLLASGPLDALGKVRPDGFMAATLLTDLADDDPLRRGELFAPVVSVATFEHPEAAWRDANDTIYGLTSAVYTQDLGLQQEAMRRLETGIVNINRRSDDVGMQAPFGGLKASGHGPREGGTYVYDGVSHLQAVYGARTDGGQ